MFQHPRQPPVVGEPLGLPLAVTVLAMPALEDFTVEDGRLPALCGPPVARAYWP